MPSKPWLKERNSVKLFDKETKLLWYGSAEVDALAAVSEFKDKRLVFVVQYGDILYLDYSIIPERQSSELNEERMLREFFHDLQSYKQTPSNRILTEPYHLALMRQVPEPYQSTLKAQMALESL